MPSLVRCNNDTSTPFKYCSHFRIPITDTDICDPVTAICDETHPHYTEVITAHSAVYTPNEIKIPTFQRGIQWDFNTLFECLSSNSPVVGTAIFGRTNQMPQVAWLLDGLQRFSTFTAMIILIEDLLFTKPSVTNVNPWNAHPTLFNDITELQNIVAINQSALPVVKYNHLALMNHRRAIIKTSYCDFILNAKIGIEKLIDTLKTGYDPDKSKDFIRRLIEFFQKPIYIQEYSQFMSIDELIATFIAINTVRVELSPADVCRSILVESYINKGANQLQSADIENLFNATLLQDNGAARKKFSPLIKVLESDWIRPKTKVIISSLFSTTSDYQIIEKEFTEFCQWIEYFTSIKSDYLNLLFDIGDNPYIATLMYYYHKNVANIASQAYVVPEVELNKIAIAYIRKLLDGTVGDTLPLTKEVSTNNTINLANFLEKINPIRSGSIENSPERTWLMNSLLNVRNKDTAKIIFNACLLPPVRNVGEYGSNYTRMNFRGGQNNWTIDHMIPENSFLTAPNANSIGNPHRDSLRNYCPILGSDNSSYKRTNLSVKMTHDSYYKTYVTPNDDRKKFNGAGHPFFQRLLQLQGQLENPALLDSADYLITEINGVCYGQQRVEIICDLLTERL